MIVNRQTGELERVRVNILAHADMKSIRKENRDGREVVIVPSATLPDGIVMNDILYTAEEIAKSFQTLEKTPAPFGHPRIGNRLLSAREPEGINRTYIGAWNENVRRKNGRVLLDKVIDIEVAGRTEDGKAVLNAIQSGSPIHTSTGLLCDLEPAEAGADHKYIARNMEFDHDAILLNEEGAGKPEQGVGMLVNGQELQVVNSAVETADRELDWAVDGVFQALIRRQRAPLVEKLKSALAEWFGSERDTLENGKEETMPITDEQFNALSGKVNALSEEVGKIGETIGNAVRDAVKPMADNLEAIQASNKAAEDKELGELCEKIVKANIMDADAAKELTLNAARALAKGIKPGKAAAINGAGFGEDGDPWADFDPNAAIDGVQKKEA